MKKLFLNSVISLTMLTTVSVFQTSQVFAVSNEEESDFKYDDLTVSDYNDSKLIANSKQKTIIQNNFDDTDCAKVEVRTVENHALFAFNSSNLTSQTKVILDEQVKWLKQHPTVKIVIEGHCDARGSQKFNLVLGKKRAEMAKKHLVEGGIDANRIRVISYGEARPIAKGTSEQDYARNRRIVVKQDKVN